MSSLTVYKKSFHRDLVEEPRIVIKGEFNSLYFSKFVNYMLKYGIVLVGTNISSDEYFVCAKKDVIYYEAERLAISKYNFKTSNHEIFLSNLVDEYDPNYLASGKHELLKNVFTESEILFLMDTHLRNIPINLVMQQWLPYSRHHEKIISYFLRKRIISQIYPLHNFLCASSIWQQNKRQLLYPRGSDLCYYFGEEIAFYFEWISFYWVWMAFPALLGILVYLTTKMGHLGGYSSVDKSPIVPFYAAAVILWGFLFTKFWQRRQSSLAYDWDTFGRVSHIDIRPEFTGTQWYNEVTKEFELHFSKSKRRLRYVLSATVLLILLTLGFFFTVCSLNLRGYVSKTTHMGYKNFFFIHYLKKFSDQKAIFDPQGPWFFIPIMMHTSLLYIMNTMIFKRVACLLTDYENHKTEADYLYYLIMKRFIFDSFESYFPLFYLAFVELDSDKLRSTLHSLFISDVVRHIMVKCIMPWMFLNVRQKIDVFLGRGLRCKRSLESFWNSVMTRDSYMANYDSFDDYLEMVIEFGYISLFASVSPMPGIVAIITNLLEIKTDCTKLLFLFKRPRVFRANGTGPWLFIVMVLTWVSVVTNVAIFGITSNQMMHLFPQWFHSVTVRQQRQYEHDTEFTKHAMLSGSVPTVLGVLMFLEHIFILLGLAIHLGINSVPKIVRRKMLEHEFVMARVYILTLGHNKDS